MKRFLLFLFLSISLCLVNTVQAQCGLYNVNVSLQSATSGPEGCKIKFDVSFDVTNNNGNKFLYLHFWKGSDYGFVNHAYLNGGARNLDNLNGDDNANPGTADDDSHPPVASVGLDNSSNTATTLNWITDYPQDDAANPVPLIIGTSKSRAATTFLVNGVSTSGYHIELKGLEVTVPGACDGLVLQGDAWGSQAQQSSQVHCLSAGIGFIGDPTVDGLILCNNPRQFQVLLSTVSTVAVTTNYNVYTDYGTIGVKDAADKLIYSYTGNFALSANNPYNSGNLNYTLNPTEATTKPGISAPLLVEVLSSGSFTKTSYGTLDNGCIVTPVKFKSFDADRKNASTVTLKWTTAMEQNNRGFYVQRYVGGDWKNVAFVFSQADGSGNSSSDLSYEYFDRNEEKGISQYRIQQVDLDYKATYSDIRAIKGEGAVNKVTIYPNPSSDGKVSVVFDNTSSLKDVQVSDLQGRTIKMYAAVKGNVLVIDELKTGFYTLKITDRSTAVSSVEKVVVK